MLALSYHSNSEEHQHPAKPPRYLQTAAPPQQAGGRNQGMLILNICSSTQMSPLTNTNTWLRPAAAEEPGHLLPLLPYTNPTNPGSNFPSQFGATQQSPLPALYCCFITPSTKPGGRDLGMFSNKTWFNA